MATLGAADLAAVCDDLRLAQREVLARLPLAALVERLDAVTRAWLAPGSSCRLQAEAILPAVTGYHPDFVRLGLRRQMKAFRAAQLRRFLAADFPDPGVLDGPRPRPGGGHAMACGPRLTFHVCAGNVPGLPAWSLYGALLLKSASLLKPASGEPVLAALLARHLSAVDPELGRCVATVWWPGGSLDLEAVAIDRADAVVAHGSDASVAALRARVPLRTRFVGYSHRVSAAYVGREALAPDFGPATVGRAAADVAWWDQQGCLQPHAVFVERGGALPPQAFAQELAAALARYEVRRPRAALSPDEHAAIRRWRADWEARSLIASTRTEPPGRAGGPAAAADPAAGAPAEEVAVYASPTGTSWTVVYAPGAGLRPTPVNRSVVVVPVDGPPAAAAALEPWSGVVQTVGVVVPPERLLSLAAALGRAGATRVAALGEAALPEAGWHHDGRPSLGELVRWVDVEAAAESLAETLDRERLG